MSTEFFSSKKIEATKDKNISLVFSSALSSEKLRILMVLPEYPPINGGVGRYTYNLVKELKRRGLEVHVACDDRGNGDYTGLS
jgi:hypothetical protein